MPELDALPFALLAAGPLASRLTRHLEGELGWQVVEPGGPVPPVFAITDVEGALRGGGPVAGLGTVLVVGADDAPAEAARAAASTGAGAVVGWPPERGAFAAAAAALDTAPSPSKADPADLRVGGASGGVGTTTVALALAGLRAWSGRPSLLLTHGYVPHPVGPTIAPEALASRDLDRAAVAARGVPGLRILHAAAPCPDRPVPGAGAAVVRDLGADVTGDVLVARRDAAGLQAIEATTAGTVLLADHGPVPVATCRRAAGGRRIVALPWSARVARAGSLGRVPASLPGSFLRAVGTALGPVRGSAGRRGRVAR